MGISGVIVRDEKGRVDYLLELQENMHAVTGE